MRCKEQEKEGEREMREVEGKDSREREQVPLRKVPEEMEGREIGQRNKKGEEGRKECMNRLFKN